MKVVRSDIIDWEPAILTITARAGKSMSVANVSNFFEKYLRYFRKSEFKKTSIDKLLSFDGSTMVNVRKKQGLEFKIPPEVQDHIVRL